jgi:hypothetical protein
MKGFDWRGLYLCGFWLLISSCSGGVGHSLRPQPLTITSAVLPQAVLGEAYGGAGFCVTAAGGVTPYRWTWAAAAGSTLPPGLRLSSNPDGTGTILGTANKTGPYGVIVTVTDSESPAMQKIATYIITVAGKLPDLQPDVGRSRLIPSYRGVNVTRIFWGTREISTTPVHQRNLGRSRAGRVLPVVNSRSSGCLASSLNSSIPSALRSVFEARNPRIPSSLAENDRVVARSFEIPPPDDRTV